MIGADILLTALEKQGVDTVFGLPGGAVIPLYDRLNHFHSIKHILVKHEQGAVHAADGYARASGKAGVCFATSGPGATNLMTGLINAQMDSIPVVAITGQVAKDLLGKDSFQEAFVTGMTQPVCKYSVMVTKAEDIPQIIENAFFIAQNGRPGPVVVDIPKDVFLENVEKPVFRCAPTPRYQMKLKNPVITKDTIRKIVRVIEQAKHPLIVIGGGVNTCQENREALEEISKAWDLPVALTLMATGAMDNKHPNYLGMVGMHGTAGANFAIQNADLLIGIGLRFDDRVTSDVKSFAPHAKIIHVDIDAAEIGKNVRVDIPVVGDAKEFLHHLREMCTQVDMDHHRWIEEVLKHRRQIRDNKTKTYLFQVYYD